MIIKMSEARPHSFLVVDRGPWSCYNILAQAGEAIGTYNFALQNVTFRKVRTPSADEADKRVAGNTRRR